MAVDRLVKERNEYKARADRLALQNENLINANANERARADHRQRERDHTLRSNAELRAYAYQVCDIVLHMRNILDQNADLVERMPLEPKITNNPSPPVVIDNYAQFDEQGIPYNSAAPLAPSPEELKHVIERLGGNGGVQ